MLQLLNVRCVNLADALKLKDRFELINPIYATLITNPSFVLFVHVQKMYRNILATWALLGAIGKGWEKINYTE